MVTGWTSFSNPADVGFIVVMAFSVAFLAAITIVMLYFVIHYRSSRHPVAEEVHESLTLEIVWTVIPTILVLGIFWVGWKGFVSMRTAPPDAMPVKVIARQWSWSFEYPNGKKDSVLRVPADRPIKLTINSADVLHSLFIPAYRIKEDCVPGMETHLWFPSGKPGTHDLFCSEYCGVAHSSMISKVIVMPEKEYAAWYSEAAGSHPTPTAETAPDDGAKLLESKGCTGCHSTDGTAKVGPSFKGVFGKKETVIRDGRDAEITVNEAFIRMTLLEPEKERVKGYPPIMPSQKDQLSPREIDAIIAHLKTLK